nr:cilia- and flagella-associated protein 251-like [Procambarus clarkii]
MLEEEGAVDRKEEEEEEGRKSTLHLQQTHERALKEEKREEMRGKSPKKEEEEEEEDHHRKTKRMTNFSRQFPTLAAEHNQILFPIQDVKHSNKWSEEEDNRDIEKYSPSETDAHTNSPARDKNLSNIDRRAKESKYLGISVGEALPSMYREYREKRMEAEEEEEEEEKQCDKLDECGFLIGGSLDEYSLRI